MLTLNNTFALYSVLTVALLFFTLIVASTKVYPTRRRFWSTVVLAWLIAYILASVLFLLLKMDTVFTIMVGSIAGYLTMGDLPFRKKRDDEEFKVPENTSEEEATKL